MQTFKNLLTKDKYEHIKNISTQEPTAKPAIELVVANSSKNEPLADKVKNEFNYERLRYKVESIIRSRIRSYQYPNER